MAKKSVIQIDVNDEKFKEFLKIFQEYQDSLEEMPEAWKKLGEAMGGTGSSFNKSATATMKILQESAMNIAGMADSLHKAVKAQEQFYHATTVSNSGMNRLVRSSSTLGKTLFSIGKELFKLASIGAIGGAVGMFGLGDSAYRRQREARGLGLSTGQISAFKTYMAPFAPEDMLNRAAQAKYDMNKWPFLGAIGIPIGKALHENPEQLAFDILNHAKARWLRVPPALRTEQMAQGTGLAQLGFNREDLQRLISTPGLRSAESNAMRSAGAMGFSSKVGDEYTRMIVTLRKAGVVIESVLIKGLAPLAKPLSDMAIAFSKDFASWIGSPGAKKAISNMGEEMREFVKFLGSKDLRDDLKQFGEAIKDVTRAILWTTQKLESGKPDFNLGDWAKAGKDLLWNLSGNLFGHDAIKAYAPNKEERMRMSIPAHMKPGLTSGGSGSGSVVAHKLSGQVRTSSPQHVHIKVSAPAGFGVERQANASGH